RRLPRGAGEVAGGTGPPDERLDRLVLGQAELIVQLRRGAVALLGPLPELTLVGAGEQRLVLLRFVFEDRLALALQFLRRQRHGHVELVRLPLLPRAAVEPDLAAAGPGGVGAEPVLR